MEKQEEDEKQITADILSVVNEAVGKYGAMRTVEGAALEADLRARSKTIQGLVERVEQRSPVTLAEYRRRLTEKMQEVLQSTTIDEGRILQEAAIYADKMPWTRRPVMPAEPCGPAAVHAGNLTNPWVGKWTF